MNKQDFNEGLLGFLDASPTPFHATANMAGMFQNAGFIRLDERLDWELEAGKKYFVTRNDSSIIAFTYPHERDAYVMVGAHTDSPNLKLKPNPVIQEHGVVKFGVESYGGLLLNPWFDRELSLAGRVSFRDSLGVIHDVLIDVQDPIAMIPSLAIHLDDKANKDRTINKQTDINPIVTCKEDFDFLAYIQDILQKDGYLDVSEILAHELSLYDTQKGSFYGIEKEFIASARLDNLLSCYVGMLSICSVENKAMLFVASDHEEVGSESASGAAGNFLQSVLKRMFPNEEQYIKTVRSSLMISADNAHAIHPNYATKHDANHAPKINEGVVVKINANQRYASNSATIARFIANAHKVDEKVQKFVTRSDMGCGSTIGPITATKIGIDTIDVGLPTWAMHSIRESAGNKDAYALYRILTQFQQIP